MSRLPIISSVPTKPAALEFFLDSGAPLPKGLNFSGWSLAPAPLTCGLVDKYFVKSERLQQKLFFRDVCLMWFWPGFESAQIDCVTAFLLPARQLRYHVVISLFCLKLGGCDLRSLVCGPVSRMAYENMSVSYKHSESQALAYTNALLADDMGSKDIVFTWGYGGT